jgi:hypothetical protein
MRKGPESVYNKWNISVVICDTDDPQRVRTSKGLQRLPKSDKIYHIVLYRVHLATNRVQTHNFSSDKH